MCVIGDIYLPRFGWSVKCFINADRDDSNSIVSSLDAVGASDSIIHRVIDKMSTGEMNGGFTYSNKMGKSSVFVVGVSSSAKEAMNTIVHEIRHLTDDIAESNHIHLTGEDVAYLAGDIAKKLFSHCHFLLCDHCRKQH